MLCISPALPGGYAFSSITSLTGTHFDPKISPGFQENDVVPYRANEPFYLLCGTSFRSCSQIGHMGGHGASQGQERTPGECWRARFMSYFTFLEENLGEWLFSVLPPANPLFPQGFCCFGWQNLRNYKSWVPPSHPAEKDSTLNTMQSVRLYGTKNIWNSGGCR